MTASRRPTASCATGAAELASARSTCATCRRSAGSHNWQNACMAYGAAAAFGIAPGVIARGHAELSRPRPPHAAGGRGRRHRLRQRLQGHQCRCGGEGALLLRQHLLDRWRNREVGRHRAAASATSAAWRRAYLIGQSTENSPRRWRGSSPVRGCGTLDRAVAAALRDAQRDGRKGAVVLLSPACASFDQYPNFEVRGDAFVKAVAGLPGVDMTIHRR